MTPTDYIQRACDAHELPMDELFARPLHERDGRDRIVVVSTAMRMARDDGREFRMAEWGEVTGMDRSSMLHVFQYHMDKANTIRMPVVIAAICAEFKVCREDLAGKGRHPNVVEARMVATRVGRDITFASYPEIARHIGRPNHSTVITAYQRFDKLTKDGGRPDLIERVARVSAVCRAMWVEANAPETVGVV